MYYEPGVWDTAYIYISSFIIIFYIPANRNRILQSLVRVT